MKRTKQTGTGGCCAGEFVPLAHVFWQN